MNPSRMIFEDAPAFIPVPADLQHRRVEAIFWPLDDNATPVMQNNTTKPRPIGLAKDRGVPLPDDFFVPLPDELLAAFNGER